MTALSAWRRFDNGVVVVNTSAERWPLRRGTRREYTAFAGDTPVATFEREPGGRGCGGVPIVRASIAGDRVRCPAVGDWLAMLDALPAIGLFRATAGSRPRPAAPSAKAQRHSPDDDGGAARASAPVPTSRRYRERVDEAGRDAIEQLREQVLRDDRAAFERRLAEYEHPVTAALRLAHDDAEPPPVRAEPPSGLALAGAILHRAMLFYVYGTVDAAEARLRYFAGWLGTSDPVDLVLAVAREQAALDLWRQPKLWSTPVGADDSSATAEVSL